MNIASTGQYQRLRASERKNGAAESNGWILPRMDRTKGTLYFKHIDMKDYHVHKMP